MSVVEHRTVDRYYAVKPTAKQVSWDVANANSVGRVRRWRIFKTDDPTFPSTLISLLDRSGIGDLLVVVDAHHPRVR